MISVGVLVANCSKCREYFESHQKEFREYFESHQKEFNVVSRDQIDELMSMFHHEDHDPDFLKPVKEKTCDWAIQEVPQEGAPFLLYKGVIVGRLYGGCPYKEMLEKLNA